MLYILLFSAVAFTGFPNGVRGSGSHREATVYADTLLRVSLPDHLQNSSLNTRSMPEYELRSHSDHNIGVKGTFQQGRLTGLATFHRMGQCGGPVYAAGGNVTFNCTMGFVKLDLSYSVKIKYGVLPSSTSQVTANLTRPFGVMEITSFPRAGSPALKRFKMATMGQVDTDIRGGLFKGEFEHLTPDFILKTMQDVQQVLHGPFADALSRAAAAVPLPSGFYN